MKKILLLGAGLLLITGLKAQSDILDAYQKYQEKKAKMQEVLNPERSLLPGVPTNEMLNTNRSSQDELYKLDSIIYEEEGVDDPMVLDPFEKEEFHYDENGNLIEEIIYEWNNPDQRWYGTERYTFSFNSSNQVIERVNYKPGASEGEWQRDRRATLEYNADGDITDQIFSEWHNAGQQWRNELWIQNSYLSPGLVDTVYIQSWSIGQGHWNPSFLETFHYNTDEQVTERLTHNWNSSQDEWVLDSRLVNTYDDDGLRIVTSFQNYAEDDDTWEEMTRTEFMYDEWGNVEENVFYSLNNQGEFQPQVLEVFSWEVERLLDRTSFIYDSFAEEWVPNFFHIYVYDDNGVPVLEEVNFQFDEGTWLPVIENRFDFNEDVTLAEVWSPDNISFRELPENWFSHKIRQIESVDVFFQPGTVLNRETFYYTEIEPTSVNEIKPVEASVFPVPASEEINFIWEGLSETMDVAIFDLSGRLVMRATVSKNKGLSVENLLPGIYIYHLADGENSVQGKISIH
ncbi:MAG: T9SS C-terminal target domain-containing protein [Saprospirales bacterium]|nr:MAG: T9SS C-terminal target domain-containing protein [Saprospirales bacterium]